MKQILHIITILLIFSTQIIFANDAQNALDKATFYYEKKDYKQALKWSRISFQKEASGEVAFNIGLAYKNLKDYDNAIIWYKKAFKMGDIDGGVNLGLLYEQVYKDYHTAIKWYKRSIKKGDISARKNLGLLYHDQHNNLNSAVYMMGMIGHPYTKERVIGLLRNDWKIDEKTLLKAYTLQKKLIPNPYLDPEFEAQIPTPQKSKRGRR